jgi:hypothetical protein
MSASSLAFDKSQIGDWSISQSPDTGICSGMAADRASGRVLMILAPDGGNMGGFVFGSRDINVTDENETNIKMKLGSAMVSRRAFGMKNDGFSLVFIPFNVQTEMNDLPNQWTFDVVHGGQSFTMPVDDFKRAKSLFDICVAERNDFLQRH